MKHLTITAISVTLAVVVVGAAPTTRPATAPASRPVDQELQDAMKKLAEICATTTAETCGVRLDYSLESLKEVDRVLLRMHKEQKGEPFNKQRLHRVSLVFGAYTGEVLRQSVGGHWEEDSSQGPRTLPFHIKDVDLQAFPLIWVEKCILNGEEESVEPKARTAALRPRALTRAVEPRPKK